MKSNSGRQMKSDQMRGDRPGKQGGLADETQRIVFWILFKTKLKFCYVHKKPWRESESLHP